MGKRNEWLQSIFNPIRNNCPNVKGAIDKSLPQVFVLIPFGFRFWNALILKCHGCRCPIALPISSLQSQTQMAENWQKYDWLFLINLIEKLYLFCCEIDTFVDDSTWIDSEPKVSRVFNHLVRHSKYSRSDRNSSELTHVFHFIVRVLIGLRRTNL